MSPTHAFIHKLTNHTKLKLRYQTLRLSSEQSRQRQMLGNEQERPRNDSSLEPERGLNPR